MDATVGAVAEETYREDEMNTHIQEVGGGVCDLFVQNPIDGGWRAVTRCGSYSEAYFLAQKIQSAGKVWVQ